MDTRTEKDSLGEMPVPTDAYYGAQTARAVANFPISGLRQRPAMLDALLHIKRAAAQTNLALDVLDSERSDAIVRAADEILGGALRDQFVVDVYQAGAGTSLHMNVNEVLANRANELLGRPTRGCYEPVHPNDHVNFGQSTNDVIPTAIRLAALMGTADLLPALDGLVSALRDQAAAFDDVIKSGRTHLQDAVPIRLGQEFGAYAANVAAHRDAVEATRDGLRRLGLGGSAVGTGLNTAVGYREQVAAELNRALGERVGVELVPADDYFEAMQSLRPAVALSGALRNLALDLGRIANDFRLLASGPTTGFAELILPAVQPGSSIMPGKVNPVMAEMLNMVCYAVIGHDATVAGCAGAGQMELNVMMPALAYHLTESLTILTNAVVAFTDKCVRGLDADRTRARRYAEGSLGLATALNTHIGYAKAAEVAKEALTTGLTLPEIVLAKGFLTEAELADVLKLRDMTEPGIPG